MASGNKTLALTPRKSSKRPRPLQIHVILIIALIIVKKTHGQNVDGVQSLLVIYVQKEDL